MSVVWPTRTPATSVMALSGPLGNRPRITPRSRRRLRSGGGVHWGRLLTGGGGGRSGGLSVINPRRRGRADRSGRSDPCRGSVRAGGGRAALGGCAGLVGLVALELAHAFEPTGKDLADERAVVHARGVADED